MTVTNLRRSFLWAALYLALIVVLGQADYVGRPIINFVSYFYLVAVIAVPVTLFFPFITRVSVILPMVLWAGIYLALLLFIDRGLTTTSDELSVVVLEFILLELGIWLAYRLALQLTHAETAMDDMALGAFPHRAEQLDEGSQRVRVEFTRSRRYHRPLAMLLMQVDPDYQTNNGEVLKSIQYDITNRFTAARIGQIIDDGIRQTDLVLRDRRWCYVLLCPETDFSSVLQLGKRLSHIVKEKTGLSVQWGIAAFPEEALTFDDMLKKARERLTLGNVLENVTHPKKMKKEISEV